MSGTGSAREVPASAQVLQMLTGKWVSMSLTVAAELGIADLLADGDKTTAELAAAVDAHEPSLYRVLRALASVGVFAETADRRFTLTPLAECLRSDAPESVRAFARFSGLPVLWRAWGELLHSVKTGETGMRAIGIQKPFEYLAEHPDEAAIFDAAMTNFTTTLAPAVVEAYDFSGFRTVADIAGGQGVLLGAILQRNPNARGVLFEMPHVVEGATKAIAAAGLTGRCQVVAGDFFQSVPEGADAYVMKSIIHDWDDESAIRILQTVRRAIPANGRLLLVEPVIPPGNDPHFGKLLDLEMLVVPGGRERTEAEYARLFAAARFKLTGVTPTRGPVSVIEGVPA